MRPILSNFLAAVPDESPAAAGGWWKRSLASLSDWFRGRPRVLAGHDLTTEVIGLIRRAENRLVLATAYLKVWAELEACLREAVGNGVDVTIILRHPERNRRDIDRVEEQAEKLRALGVTLHFVERFHGKVYLSDDEVIISSFNLTGGSQSSVDLGVHLRGALRARHCYRQLGRYCPGLLKRVSLVRRRKSGSRSVCIGCAKPKIFNANKPFCRACYYRSKRGAQMNRLPARVCHGCGCKWKSTLWDPLCPSCAASHGAARALS